jgi:hypothetical protein
MLTEPSKSLPCQSTDSQSCGVEEQPGGVSGGARASGGVGALVAGEVWWCVRVPHGKLKSILKRKLPTDRSTNTILPAPAVAARQTLRLWLRLPTYPRACCAAAMPAPAAEACRRRLRTQEFRGQSQ